jgi:NTP pyrophosphatase (non-canonical NTP hydrolase)
MLWYIASMCDNLGIKMEDVAQGNIEKLKSRRDRGTLHGSGDNR